MVYTPPAANAVNFPLRVYIPPAANLVNFVMSASESSGKFFAVMS